VATVTAGTESSIVAAGLTKRYGKTVALRDVSFEARAGTATALMRSRPVVVTGTDPDLVNRHALWDIIRGLIGRGTTVLLTTQYLDEADALADAVVFIDATTWTGWLPPTADDFTAGLAQLEELAPALAEI
jgi:ABC-2 type transport system ATP-binding protein